MASRLDDIIDSSTAALVGIALICTAVLPVGLNFINGLEGEAADFKPLLMLVIFMAIIGLVIGVIKTFQSRKE